MNHLDLDPDLDLNSAITIRPYNSKDPIEEASVISMVNTCYRTSVGWTNEVNIASGPRLRPEHLRRDAKAMSIFVAELTTATTTQVVACIKTGLCITSVAGPLEEPAGYIGLFAVHPLLQQRGLGGRLVSYAENFCQSLGAKEMILDVIDRRTDIIAWYQRRGFKLTEQFIDGEEVFKDIGDDCGLLVPVNFRLMRKSLAT